MKKDIYSNLSNAEIKIKIKEMEDEYEALKSKVKECLMKMEKLDKSYTEANNVLEKRTKGKV